VVLVHCIELPELVKARDSHMSPSVLANMWKEEEARTKTLEERLRLLMSEKEVPGTLRTASGKPGEVICQIADEVNAAMIITGTRGMGKMKRTILGSVSDHLVTHATCPVMICRDPAEMERKRHNSEGKGKLRHGSGDSLGSFTASLRQRFSSGGRAAGGRSASLNHDKDELVLGASGGAGASGGGGLGAKKKENRDPKHPATAEEDEDEPQDSPTKK